MLTVARYERLKREKGSAARLARSIELDQNRYTFWEGGKPFYHLRSDEVEKIAQALGVATDAIADEKGGAKFVE